jgi:hypothetical protein
MPATEPEAPVGKPSAEFWKRRRGKNVAIALTIAGLCALFYAITIVKMVK